jgi:hypothetical protein
MRMGQTISCWDCGRQAKSRFCGACGRWHRCQLCEAYIRERLTGNGRCPSCRSALTLFEHLVKLHGVRRGPRPKDLAERLARYERRATAGEPLFG